MKRKSEPRTAVGSFTPTITTGMPSATYVVPTLPGYPPTYYPGMGTPIGQYGFSIPGVNQHHLGHILGNPEVVAHCPFCGSGDIVAGGDQTISCSFCNRSFLVMEQPQYNAMPGQPGASTDATMPGGDVPDPTDPNAADPAADPAQVTPAPAHQPVNPQTDPDELKKAPPFKFGGSLKEDRSIFRTASGHPVSEDDFVAHIAFRVARDHMVS